MATGGVDGRFHAVNGLHRLVRNRKRNRTLYQDFHAGLYRPARRAGHQLPDTARRARRDRLPAASRFQQDYRRDDPQGDGPVVFLDEPRVGLHDHLRLLHPQRRKPAESGIDGGPVGYVGRNPVGYRHFSGGFFVRHQPHLGSGTGFSDAAEYFRADARAATGSRSYSSYCCSSPQSPRRSRCSKSLPPT